MEKRTVVNLIPGQEYELRTQRGMRVSYPLGKTKPTVIVARDLGTWVPEPTPEPPPTGDPAFLSRPASGPLESNVAGPVTIENVTIRGGTVNAPRSSRAIIVRNATALTIRNVDISDWAGAIYLYNCTGPVLIENVRSRNIGDGTIGSGGSNHIQFAESSMVGFVRNCQFLGGWTEDMVSTWHSGGQGTGKELIIENNRFQGLVADTATARAWKSGSGTGIIIGDGRDSPRNGYVIVRNNTLLTPGQVGLQHIDGPGIQTYGNVIYGEKRPGNNNPITSWEGNPKGVIRDNRYYWVNENGSEPAPWLHQNPSGLQMINNVRDPSIDPNAMRITL